MCQTRQLLFNKRTLEEIAPSSSEYLTEYYIG